MMMRFRPNCLPAMARPRQCRGSQPAIWFSPCASVFLGCLVALGCLACSVTAAYADGGTVRLSETVGGYRVSAFTAPVPLRAGPVDVSVLVQDAATGQPLSEARVWVALTSGERYPATPESATNKLFHAAQFELPAAGRYVMEVEVEGLHGPARTRFEVEASEPLPRWAELWLWIALPVVPVGLFAVHQLLVRRPRFSPRDYPSGRG